MAAGRAFLCAAALLVAPLSTSHGVHAFQSASRSLARRPAALHALSPRQLQFWEDVEDGLEDVAKFYDGQSMERIRTFCQR